MRYKINLFPPREQNIVDKGIYFSFHYLRYILVITQIIVIGVFFYRFKVDQEIVDLKDALNQKQEIISVSQPLIKEVEAVEAKITTANKLITDQKKFSDQFDYFLSIFPEKLNLTKLAVTSDGEFEISGTTNDPASVKLFYERLKKDNKFAVVDVKSLKKDITGYVFIISLQTKKATKKK